MDSLVIPATIEDIIVIAREEEGKEKKGSFPYWRRPFLFGLVMA